MALTKIKTALKDISLMGYSNNIPNKLTIETIEKALKGVDVEVVDGDKELFENLDMTEDEQENSRKLKIKTNLRRIKMAKKLMTLTEMSNNFIAGREPEVSAGDMWDEVIETPERKWYRYGKIWASIGIPTEEEEQRFKAIEKNITK